MMKCLYVLLAIAGAACGVNYDGFRVKFGWSGALQDKEYFFRLPRTVSLAEGGGWRRVERPAAPLPELRLYCRPDDINVCPLYDTAGFVAGLQVAVPAEALQALPYDPAKKFVKWRDQAVGDTKRDYWTSTLYFVSEESLKSGAGPRLEAGATLQDGGVWASAPAAPDKLLRIPLHETDIAKTLYKKENCIPNMGTHYYYNMTSELACADFFPWFALVKEGQLIGAGFQIFGKMEPTGEKDWFETPPARAAEITIPTAPACVSEWSSTYGVLSLHVYFIEEPWNIKCEDGDSLQPMSVVNRLILNTSRYANKLVDEAKKLFSG